MTEPQHEEPLAFERIVFFSDAVFAIAITLLVLEIKVPHLPHAAGAGETLTALGLLIPKVVGYVVSFAVLGMFWVEHHRIFRYIGHFDGGLLGRNLAMLLTVAFVPFPTALFSENYANPVALAVYALTLLGVGLSKIWIWRYAVQTPGLLQAGTDAALIRTISRRSWAMPISSGLVALLAILGQPWAYALFGTVPLVAWALGRGVAKPMTTAILTLVIPLAGWLPHSRSPVDQLRFLTGCWERRTARGVVEERWSTPKGGMLQGMGRTFRGDSLVGYEFVLIREIAGRIVYEAHPSGQASNLFPLKAITDTLVEFEDLAHDFPQRVGYRRAGADSLIAWIEGTTPRGPRHIDFPYARVACDSR